ncbi:MAG TPA: hypothetical protein VIL72_01285, partial [Beijerinckiaceae bacterium]
DGWTQGYARGLAAPGGAAPFARELGMSEATGPFGSLSFGDETCFHAGYREWRRLLGRAARRERPA